MSTIITCQIRSTGECSFMTSPAAFASQSTPRWHLHFSRPKSSSITQTRQNQCGTGVCSATWSTSASSAIFTSSLCCATCGQKSKSSARRPKLQEMQLLLSKLHRWQGSTQRFGGSVQRGSSRSLMQGMRPNISKKIWRSLAILWMTQLQRSWMSARYVWRPSRRAAESLLCHAMIGTSSMRTASSGGLKSAAIDAPYAMYHSR